MHDWKDWNDQYQEPIPVPTEAKIKGKKHKGMRDPILIVGILLALGLVGFLAGRLLKSSPEPVDRHTPEESFFAPVDESRIGTDRGVSYSEGRLIVVSALGVDYAGMEELFSSHGMEIIGYIPLTDTYQVSAPDAPGLEDLNALAEKLRQDPRVELAQAELVWEPGGKAYPNDPWGNADWNGMDDGNWGAIAIQAPYCWENYELGPVQVGVIDTMFDSDHEDLRDRIVETHYNEIYNRYSERDASWSHGSHVAGIIGAAHNNGAGLSGVLEDGRIHTYSLWGFSNEMSTLSAIAELASGGARAINYSIGYVESIGMGAYLGDEWMISYYYEQQAETVKAALGRLLDKGYDFVLVSSAGNESIDARWGNEFTYIQDGPVGDRILVVGAAEQWAGAYYLASFSNFGSRLDVCAPGVRIYSCVAENGYELWNGTSMAAPYVTGVCAAVWAADPGLTGAQVKAIIRDSADFAVSGGPNLLDMKSALARVLAPGETLETIDLADTYWTLRFGDGQDHQYDALFLANGSFSAREYRSGICYNGEYVFSGGELILTFPAEGGRIRFTGDETGFVSAEQYYTAGGSVYYQMDPLYDSSFYWNGPAPTPTPVPTPVPTPIPTPAPVPTPTPAPPRSLQLPSDPQSPYGIALRENLIQGVYYSDEDKVTVVGSTFNNRHKDDGSHMDWYRLAYTDDLVPGYRVELYYADGMLFFANATVDQRSVVTLHYWGDQVIAVRDRRVSSHLCFPGSQVYDDVMALFGDVYNQSAYYYAYAK